MNQLSLFQPLARKRDPKTSFIAAEKAGNFKARHETIIFNAICDAGSRGATYREIARAIGMEPVAVGRRLAAMGRRGLITRAPKSDCRDFESREGMAIWWRS